jgi:hypothetical protein
MLQWQRRSGTLLVFCGMEHISSNEKVWIVVLSCRRYRDCRQRAVRETWGMDVPSGCELLTVEGGYSGEPRMDDGRLLLPVVDDYAHLAEKTFRAIAWLVKHFSFSGVLKCDDDTYVHARRFLQEFDRRVNYSGNIIESLSMPVRYAQGGGYWLSRSACETLVRRPFASYGKRGWFLGQRPMRKRGECHIREVVSIEDFMVGDILHAAGVEVTHDDRFNPDPFPSVYDRSDLFTSHHVRPVTMRRIHSQPLLKNHFFGRLWVCCLRWLPSSRKPH